MEKNKIINKIVKIYPNFIRERLEELDNEFLEGILYDDRSKILPYVSSYENFIKGLELKNEQLSCLINAIYNSGKMIDDYDTIQELPRDQIIDIYNHLDELESVALPQKEIEDMYNLFCLRFKETIEKRKLINLGMIIVTTYVECCNMVSNELLLNIPKFDYVYSYYENINRVNSDATAQAICYVIEDNHIEYIENDKIGEYLNRRDDLCWGGDIYYYIESEIHDIFFKPIK